VGNTKGMLMKLNYNLKPILMGLNNYQSKSIDFRGIFFFLLWKFQLTVWLLISFKISSLVFSRRKKFIQGWNNLRVS